MGTTFKFGGRGGLASGGGGTTLNFNGRGGLTSGGIVPMAASNQVPIVSKRPQFGPAAAAVVITVTVTVANAV
ncbi:hypothetical protein DL770_002710 [Monosporascus sp. CRB-9-2]|nr:hypothetical protein DL770_002710 [Monosporascus sp. CRB-9-2]